MIYKYPSITRQVGGPTWMRSQKTWPYDGVDRLPVSATTASSSSAQLQPGPYRTVRDHGRVPSALSFEQFSARAARPSMQACRGQTYENHRRAVQALLLFSSRCLVLDRFTFSFIRQAPSWKVSLSRDRPCVLN